jgi:hypothetical protein
MKYINLLLLICCSKSYFAQQASFLNLKTDLGLNSTRSFTQATSLFGPMRTYSTPSRYKLGDFSNEILDGGATRFNGKKNWTLNKKELRVGLGATQFLGDLGGRNQIGTDYRLKDLDWKSTSMGAMVGYRYRFRNLFATTTSIGVGMLKGDDALTTEHFRSERNLSFRAPFLDVAQRLEFMVYLKEKVGKRYNIRGLKGFKNRNEQVYVFGGVGVVGFISQARYQGRWYNLRPLSTEGQGLLGGIKKTIPITLTVPMGIGFRVGISREWRIGMEASYVKTFSDYIDDVHGVYYDRNKLLNQKGEIAAALSDRSYGNTQGYKAGEQRGDKQNDSYYYLNVVLTRNVTYKNYTKTHKHFKLQKGKYKF